MQRRKRVSYICLSSRSVGGPETRPGPAYYSSRIALRNRFLCSRISNALLRAVDCVLIILGSGARGQRLCNESLRAPPEVTIGDKPVPPARARRAYDAMKKLSPKILVFDDEPRLRDLLLRYLTDTGLQTQALP